MNWESDFEELQRVMPPPVQSPALIEWDRIAATWGQPFPPDYQQFIELYGPGEIDAVLTIDEPEAKVSLSEARTDGMVEETANAEDLWVLFDQSAELEAVEPFLISWGVTNTADQLCWDASGPDPARWPVLVGCRNDGQWNRCDCGMVTFLIRLLRGEGFPRCLIGSANLWGQGHAEFERSVYKRFPKPHRKERQKHWWSRD